VVVSLLLSAVAPAHAVQQHNALNPLRKVITLLQDMQEKVKKEGARELDLYDKFMCYCKSGAGDLSRSIGGAETKISSVSSSIAGAEAKLAASKAKLKQSQEERAAAFESIAQAKAIRTSEASAFAKLKADLDTNVAACDKAITALSSGVAGSFLQTPAALALKQATSQRDLDESDRSVITAFLSGSSDYAPQSGQIIGILKQMRDEMASDLAGAIATEEAAVASHTSFVGAKKKEIAALQNSVEAKTQLIGELGVSIARMKHDLTDTQEALAGDQQFLAELDKSCATKTAEWEERSKTRNAELAALADTIKVLNDDDALELFKSTLPGPTVSLVQVQAGISARRNQALQMIRAAQRQASSQDKPGLELLALAFAGKQSKSGFGKIITMIENMVKTLKKEQTDDDNKKEYCALTLDSSDDKKKALERTVATEESSIAAAQEMIATLASEIAALEAGITSLDASVAAATAQRKAENAEYKDLVASNTAAKQLLQFATNRLNQFYNPKLYKPPAKAELSSEDRIYSNMGNPGGILTTAAPSGIAGTGIAVLAQVFAHKQAAAPAPPPETWGVYAKKSGETGGVISMITMLIGDLDKEITEAETSEKDAQADYGELMKDSAAKRATDSKVLTEKTAAKADTEADLEAHTDAKAAGVKELSSTIKYIASLHSECDWLLQYFDVRKQARADEVDSLLRAKAVLGGADFSLL